MRKRPSKYQLRLPLEDWERDETLAAQRRNEEAELQIMFRRYPRRQREVRLLGPLVRCSRHVPLWECRPCPLATEDHSLPADRTLLVCLKDLNKVQRKEKARALSPSPDRPRLQTHR